jgi:transcriptional regulator with XRE-family HTH domain
LRPLEGVRELRERRMLSQQELADRAGVSLFTVQRIERGEGSVRPKTGRAIAAALGVGVEDLLGKAQAPLPDFDAQQRRSLVLEAFNAHLRQATLRLQDFASVAGTDEDFDRVHGGLLGRMLYSDALALLGAAEADVLPAAELEPVPSKQLAELRARTAELHEAAKRAYDAFHEAAAAAGGKALQRDELAQAREAAEKAYKEGTNVVAQLTETGAA